MELATCGGSRNDDDDEEEGEDHEAFLEASLFLNEDYQIQKYAFEDESIELYSLQSSSTDFDLTGQMVWPGAELLADYLLKNKSLLHGSSILELGAGVGLAGLLCAKYCEDLVLTDHNDTVLKVLQMNVDHQIPSWSPAFPNVQVQKLEWGCDDHIKSILEKNQKAFNLVIGADLCYQESFVPPLFRTMKLLLQQRVSGSSALLAYISRIKRMDPALVTEASKHHFEMREVPGTRRSVCGGLYDGWVYEISFQASA